MDPDHHPALGPALTELQHVVDAIQSATPRVDHVAEETAAIRSALQSALVHLALAIQSLLHIR